MPYNITVEIIRGDTKSNLEYADLSINGQTFSRCNPIVPNDCKWHDCGWNRELISVNGDFDITATFSNQVDDGGSKCTLNGTRTYGAVRVTLQGKKGKPFKFQLKARILLHFHLNSNNKIP